MSESAGSASGLRYRRRERSPFRVIDGRCLIGAPGHKAVVLGGSAVMVWSLLDAPGSAAELLTRIRDDWPELEEVTLEQVQDAVDALVAGDLVSTADTSEVNGTAEAQHLW